MCVLLASQSVVFYLASFFDVVTLTPSNVNLFLSRDREPQMASLPHSWLVFLSLDLFYLFIYLFVDLFIYLFAS